MGRESTPLKRTSVKNKKNIIINIADIFRNESIQNQVIKNLKRI